MLSKTSRNCVPRASVSISRKALRLSRSSTSDPWELRNLLLDNAVAGQSHAGRHESQGILLRRPRIPAFDGMILSFIGLDPRHLQAAEVHHEQIFVPSGHFYQGAHFDPWIGDVLPEGSAAPEHDWNARITKEVFETYV